MQLTEQHIIKDDRFKDWCIKAKDLYNQSLYYWRQSLFGNIQYFNEYELVGLLQEYNDDKFRALPANTSQQIIKYLFKSVKAWQNSRKEYVKNPSKFNGKPKLPKYKKELSCLYFTYAQIKPKDGYLRFPKMMNLPPIKTKVKRSDFKQCRIIPRNDHFVVEIIYEKSEVLEKKFNSIVMGLDMGVNNLVSCSINTGYTFIINGKPIKSINQFFNKRSSNLQKTLPQKQNTSPRIRRIAFKRNQKIKNYMHHASKYIINEAIKNDVSTIVIGNNKNWKHEINMGKKVNQTFASIPYQILIGQIEYKARLQGIQTITTEESYTSKCSFLDKESLNKHEKYAGKRVKRGLFETAKGLKVNADIQASCNIIRKVFPDLIFSDGIVSCLVQPVKIKDFNNKSHNKQID